MKQFLISSLFAIGAAGAYAQTRIDLRTQSKSIDFSAAASTRPVKTGTALPAACSPGELFFKTDAPEGKNLYGCTGAARWKEVSGAAAIISGCGLSGCEDGTCSVDSSIIPSYTGALSDGYLLLGGGGSMLRALTPGAAGQVLTSNGPGIDPSWTWAVAGSSGEPALGFVPLDREQNLADLRSASLARANLGLGDAAVRNAGNTAGTVAAGDDPRLWDARNPLAHKTQHASGGTDALSPSDIGAEAAANKGQPNGYAPLDAAGKLPAAYAPTRAVPMYQQYVAARCQSGIAFSAFSLPDANAPVATCVNGSAVAGVLAFANKTNNQSLQDHFELPPDWTGDIDLEVAGRSGDSEHAAVLTVQTACVAGGAIDNPVFGAGQSSSITGNASAGRTVATLAGVNAAGCAAGSEYYFKITADTMALAAPYTFDLISLRWTVRRSY